MSFPKTFFPQQSFSLLFFITGLEGLLAAIVLLSQPSEIQSRLALGLSARMWIIVLVQVALAGLAVVGGYKSRSLSIQRQQLYNRLLASRWILVCIGLLGLAGITSLLLLFWLPDNWLHLRPQITRVAPLFAWTGIAIIQFVSIAAKHHFTSCPLSQFEKRVLTSISFVILCTATLGLAWKQPAEIGNFFRIRLILPLIWGSALLLLVNSQFAPKSIRWIGYPVALVLFCLPLLDLWANGYSHPSAFLGLFPFSDAQGYYSDARKLIEGHPFSDFSGRRPFFSGFLALLLLLTGQNLQFSVLILTLLVATACYLAGQQLQQTDNPLSAALLVMLLFFFIRFFIGTVLTETLGIIWGCISFILLWRGFAIPHRLCLLSGIFILALALNTRAGPFFVLPCIIVAALFVFPKERAQIKTILIGGLLAILIGFALNSISARILSPDALPFSNFLHSLYGLVTGGKGWMQIFVDHPELKYLPDRDFAAGAYPVILEAFQSNPSGLIKGILKTYQDFFSLGRVGAFSFLNGEEKNITQAFQALLFLLSLLGLWRIYRTPQKSDALVLATFAGVLGSVPFLPPGDAYFMRVQAAVIPILLIIPIRGINQIIIWLTKNKDNSPAYELPLPTSGPAIPVIIALAFSALVLIPPMIMRYAIRPISQEPASCTANELSYTVRILPANVIQILDDRQIDQDWVPDLSRSTFTKNLHDFMYTRIVTSIDNVNPPPVAIANVISLLDGEPLWLIDNHNLLNGRNGITHVCGYWLKPPWERSGAVITPVIDVSVFYVSNAY